MHKSFIIFWFFILTYYLRLILIACIYTNEAFRQEKSVLILNTRYSLY
jgi:hypothetical protein